MYFVAGEPAGVIPRTSVFVSLTPRSGRAPAVLFSAEISATARSSLVVEHLVGNVDLGESKPAVQDIHTVPGQTAWLATTVWTPRSSSG
jgi:hypothetical protein